MKKKLFLALITLAIFQWSCNSDSNKNSNSGQATKNSPVYGGTLVYGANELPQSLTPASILDIPSAHIAAQIFQGLVRFDPKDLKILPCIAKKWNMDASGTVYTFHLRTDVKFQDNPCFQGSKGRTVTAKDVAYSFKRLCTKSPNNFVFGSTFKDLLKGADDFYAASATSKPMDNLAGIKVINDSTIQLELVHPSSYFLSVLASVNCSIVPKEGIEQYGAHCNVGTGPFVLATSSQPDQYILLVKNPDYYGKDTLGNKLPFLDSVKIVYIKSKSVEFSSFKDNKVDVASGLPSSEIKDLVEKQISKFQNKPAKYILNRTPQMATQYYDFNLQKPYFKDVRVRKAFNYAINRKKIVNDVLKGEAYGPGIHGIVPPTFKNYDITKINGYTYNPDTAKKLFAAAGYPGGKGFPAITIELNGGGAKNTIVAFDIQKQLKNVLGINVETEVVSLAQKIQDAENGNGDIFRDAWIADYPSPKSFLLLLNGQNVPKDNSMPSYLNVSRYQNAKYDSLYLAGISASNIADRNKYFYAAEQQMIDDAPIMVLWYNEKYTLINAKVHNLMLNPLDYLDFSQVYIKTLPKGKTTAKDKK